MRTKEEIINGVFPPTIDQAIDEVACHLPKNYMVNIFIEKDGYDVKLEDDEYNDFDVDGGYGIRSDIHAALIMAIDQQHRKE